MERLGGRYLNIVDPWLAVHIVGVVMAIGSVTVTDGFFVVFHFHPIFGKILARVAPLLSMIVWTGFLLLALSGTALVIKKPSTVTDPMFQLKMILTGIIYLNGIALSFWATPRFQEFTEENVYEYPWKFELLAGLGASVSITGWWTTLFFAYFVV